MLNLERYFARVTIIARGTVAQEAVVTVNTGTAIGTRCGVALMDIFTAVSAIVTSRALARVRSPQRHVGTLTTVQTRTRRAFVYV